MQMRKYAIIKEPSKKQTKVDKRAPQARQRGRAGTETWEREGEGKGKGERLGGLVIVQEEPGQELNWTEAAQTRVLGSNNLGR